MRILTFAIFGDNWLSGENAEDANTERSKMFSSFYSRLNFKLS